MESAVYTQREEGLLRHRIDELSVRMRDAEAEVSALRESAYTELVTVELMKKDISFIKSGMEEMLVTVKELTKAPAARWNGLVTAIVSASAAAAVSFLNK